MKPDVTNSLQPLPLIAWGVATSDNDGRCTCWYWMNKGRACPMHSRAQLADFRYVSNMMQVYSDKHFSDERE